MRKVTFALLLALSQSALAQNPETKIANCIIQQPLQGKNMTGAFLQFEHKGSPVILSHAEIPSVTASVEIHSMEMKDNVMSMIPLTDNILNEGVREFKKGADHLMLMQIADNKLPKAGEKHEITVFFKTAPTAAESYSAKCEAEVKTVEEIIAAQGGDAHHHHHHHHAHGHNHSHEQAPTKK